MNESQGVKGEVAKDHRIHSKLRISSLKVVNGNRPCPSVPAKEWKEIVNLLKQLEGKGTSSERRGTKDRGRRTSFR